MLLECVLKIPCGIYDNFIKKKNCFSNLFQADIMDVNQIFKDLGMLVHEQGEVLGKIVSGLLQSYS